MRQKGVTVFTVWVVVQTALAGWTGLKEVKWSRIAALDGSSVHPSAVTLQMEHLTKFSKGACAAACAKRLWCRSFFFVSSSRSCDVHEEVFNSTTALLSVPGACYFKQACLTRPGYSVEPHSGLCYKIHYEALNVPQALTACGGEGGYLVTLDTDTKMAGIMDVLIHIPALLNKWLHVGASRPVAEFNTPWTANSSFFIWNRTGQLVDIKWFVPTEPNYNQNSSNTIDFGIRTPNYTNFTHFTSLYDGNYGYTCGFICEIVL